MLGTALPGESLAITVPLCNVTDQQLMFLKPT